MRLLLIEDNRAIAQIIFDYFDDSSVEIDYSANGAHGFQLALTETFDCILLDVSLPTMNGFEICNKLRELGDDTPIIMITANDSNKDMLTGLKGGADDYVIKPFDMELLEARIESLLRRTSAFGFKTQLNISDLTIDLRSRKVTRQGKTIKLNPSCFKILKLLAEKSPGVVSRREIERQLWLDDIPDKDILRKHIHLLRNKIDKPFDSRLIQTRPKQGYLIQAS